MPVIQGITLPNSSQIGPLSAVTWPSTVAHTLVATTVAQTLQHKTLSLGTLSALEAGTTAANLVNYGISTLTWSTAGDPAYTLAAPAAGVEKVLVLQTTTVQDSTAIFTSVYTGSTAIFIANPSTAYAANLYAGFQPPLTSLTLLGLTTALWGVRALQGGVKFSTSATFSS